MTSKILDSFSRKTGYIIFALFISMSFSLGGALANSCQGGVDCSNCALREHLHVPRAHRGMENNGCRTVGQNSSCGFQASRSSDEFYDIASTIRSGHHECADIFAAASDEYGQSHLSREFLLQAYSPGGPSQIPIYLLYHSLLC